MSRRSIVLDANILIRAVLGRRVRTLIMDHTTKVSFFAPDTAFEEARNVKLYLSPEEADVHRQAEA